jgi:hypothetical protein
MVDTTTKGQVLNQVIQLALAKLGNPSIDTFAYTASGVGVMVTKQKIGDYAIDYSRAHITIDPTTGFTTYNPINWLSDQELSSIALPKTTITADQAQKVALDFDSMMIGKLAPHQVGQTIVKTEVSQKVIDASQIWTTEQLTFPLAVIAVRVQRSQGSMTYYVDPEKGTAVGWATPTP